MDHRRLEPAPPRAPSGVRATSSPSHPLAGRRAHDAAAAHRRDRRGRGDDHRRALQQRPRFGRLLHPVGRPPAARTQRSGPRRRVGREYFARKQVPTPARRGLGPSPCPARSPPGWRCTSASAAALRRPLAPAIDIAERRLPRAVGGGRKMDAGRRRRTGGAAGFADLPAARPRPAGRRLFRSRRPPACCARGGRNTRPGAVRRRDRRGWLCAAAREQGGR